MTNSAKAKLMIVVGVVFLVLAVVGVGAYFYIGQEYQKFMAQLTGNMEFALRCALEGDKCEKGLIALRESMKAYQYIALACTALFGISGTALLAIGLTKKP